MAKTARGKLTLYCVVGVVLAVVLLGGCAGTGNDTSAETGTESAQAPTESPAPSPTNTVTPSPTPEPTPTNTPTPTPIPTTAPAEVHFALNDVWSEDFLSVEYFDTDKSDGEQIEDRKEYLRSFESKLSDAEIDTLVKCINKDTTQEAMTQNEIDALPTIVGKVFDYNMAHQDDMIPLSLLGLNLNENEKIIYDYAQCIGIRTRNEVPKDAQSEVFWSYKYTDFFAQLSHNDSVLKPTVKKGDREVTKLTTPARIDTSCIVLSCLYARKTLEPYPTSAFKNGVMEYSKRFLNDLYPKLKTVEDSGKTLQ